MKPSDKLRRFYDVFSVDDQVLVVINADPDAIASAMAIKRLLWLRVAGISISCVNVIKRPDNLAMIRILGVKLIHVDQIKKDQYTRFVIVDSQPNHHESFLKFDFDAVIDHHPDTQPGMAFADIRPAYGATSSIMTEYLRAAKINPSTKLATGLFFAIKTDTNNFERKTLAEDLKAFQFLFQHINVPMARKIEQSEIPPVFLKYFKIALDNMKFRNARVFVHLGNVSNPDACVVIADFFMRVSSIRWSIISGIWANKIIIVFRNDGIRKNAGKVAKESFEKIGSAGGHKSIARAEIALSELKGQVDPSDNKKLTNWVIKQIEKNAGKK